MSKEKLLEEIKKTQEQRDKFMMEANAQIGWFNGRLALLQELLAEEEKKASVDKESSTG